MAVPPGTVSTAIGRFATGLRYPVLFAITAAVFLLDLVVPDLIPFVDEILLGLFTLLLGGMKKRVDGRPPETPR